MDMFEIIPINMVNAIKFQIKTNRKQLIISW